MINKTQKKTAYRWLMQQGKIAKPWVRLKILVNYISSLLLILQAWLIASIVDKALIHAVSLKNLMLYLIALISVMLIRALISWQQELLGFKASELVRTKLRQEFLTEIEARGPIKLAHEKAGSINSLYIEHIEGVNGFYADYLPQMSLAILIPLTIFLFVIPMDWIAALILLFTAPLIPLFMALIGMGVESANQRHFKSLAKLSADFLDKLKGLTTLKLLNRSKDQIEKIEETADEYRRRTMTVLRVAFLSSGALELFSSVAIAIVAIVLGLTLLKDINVGYFGELTLAKALFILLLAPEFFLPLRQLGVHYHARAEAIAAAHELAGFIRGNDESKSKTSIDSRLRGNDERKRGNDEFEIKVRQLNFAYTPEKIIIKNLSFTIQPQQKVAIVGHSGKGKTTLLYLLMGFLQPQQGEICINEQSLEEINLPQWREKIAYFGQNPQLLPMSIKENIKFAKADASDEEIKKAAAKAGVMDFVNILPKGLDTVLSEQNLGVSGGQAQRIALARIFLADKPIIILDEPTASLDAATEEKLIKNILENCQNKTLVLISHRTETLKLADETIILT